MVKLTENKGVYLINSKIIIEDENNFSLNYINDLLKKQGLKELEAKSLDKEAAKLNTISNKILLSHNTSGDRKNLKLKFDSLASHDITYVGIIQTARASKLEEFPVPYVLTNCHNSLCAVGGTINEDDHMFGLSAAQKYGGIFVPAHQAVIHQYVREMMTGCGKMILGSDSHTRYGSLGTMGIGEGGPEIVKQLLKKTYDIQYPEIILVYLENELANGVGPQDVALAIIKAVFQNGYVKNKVLEFNGPGIDNLSVDFRNGVDVMTTETTCLSSIWRTDDAVKEFYHIHNRPDDFQELEPQDVAYYDGLVKIDLSKIVPLMALPFHPSNVFTVKEVAENPRDFLIKIEDEAKTILENSKISFKLTDKIINKQFKVDQGIVAGCDGGLFENIDIIGQMMKDRSIGNTDFSLSVYPASQPIHLELIRNGTISTLMNSGAVIRSAFCGPCFGAGDVPANEGFSIRHTTRNFPNREGSKPSQGQLSCVALMDARSIAATAINKGILTPATEINFTPRSKKYFFDDLVYKNRVFIGFKKADKKVNLKLGPNIVDWPEMTSLPDNIILKVVSVIKDQVTTTDELIPSGETSSYRSNPLKLAEFTLSRKDPEYVARAKKIDIIEKERIKLLNNKDYNDDILKEARTIIKDSGLNINLENTGIGSVVAAKKPGDGSAREQAASCQKVLGGWANISIEYATKRYRSNLINWGMLPFIIDEKSFSQIGIDDFIIVRDIRKNLIEEKKEIAAVLFNKNKRAEIKLFLPELTKDERDIIIAGSLINYYRN